MIYIVHDQSTKEVELFALLNDAGSIAWDDKTPELILSLEMQKNFSNFLKLNNNLANK